MWSERKKSRDCSAYEFYIAVPDNEVGDSFRATMNRSDLIGFQHPNAKVMATGPSGNNLIYW